MEDTAAQSSSPTLRVEHIQVAAASLALAVQRGAFSIEEVDNVSHCYKSLKAFLDAWQKAQTPAEDQQSAQQPAQQEKQQ